MIFALLGSDLKDSFDLHDCLLNDYLSLASCMIACLCFLSALVDRLVGCTHTFHYAH